MAYILWYVDNMELISKHNSFLQSVSYIGAEYDLLLAHVSMKSTLDQSITDFLLIVFSRCNCQ